jgi:predicted membrane channel-forming protein YqfA (hemolysin III family)
MHELISLSQANHIMIAILIAAPVIGAVWGAFTKQLVRCLVYGIIIGVGNFALWNVYNVITDHLGLDTVKNLVVNLVLFIVVGIVSGLLIGRFNRQEQRRKSADTTE